MADQYSNLTVVSDYEIVLQDADIAAVLVALPPIQPYEAAKLALESGKHVFVEKPMTTRVDEACRLVEIGERNHLTLVVWSPYGPSLRPTNSEPDQ